MDSVYFSPSLLSFIPAKWKDDGTHSRNVACECGLADRRSGSGLLEADTNGGKQLGVVDDGPASGRYPATVKLRFAEISSKASSLNTSWILKLLIARGLLPLLMTERAKALKRVPLFLRLQQERLSTHQIAQQ
jgi:hypothetical protein